MPFPSSLGHGPRKEVEAGLQILGSSDVLGSRSHHSHLFCHHSEFLLATNCPYSVQTAPILGPGILLLLQLHLLVHSGHEGRRRTVALGLRQQWASLGLQPVRRAQIPAAAAVAAVAATAPSLASSTSARAPGCRLRPPSPEVSTGAAGAIGATKAEEPRCEHHIRACL